MLVDLFGNSRVPTPVGVDSVGNGFNSYSAGNKTYGAGRSMPNIGPVADLLGYAQRDNEQEARKNAILRRMEGQGTGNPSDQAIAGYTTATKGPPALYAPIGYSFGGNPPSSTPVGVQNPTSGLRMGGRGLLPNRRLN